MSAVLAWGWRFPEDRLQVVALYETSMLMAMTNADVRGQVMRWEYATRAEAEEACMAQTFGAEALSAVMIREPVVLALSFEAEAEAERVVPKTRWTDAPHLYRELMAMLPS